MHDLEDPVAAAAREGDEGAFTALTERHQRELQVHLYRMTGSLEDAEDLVQETFLRAWRRRETYAGRASFRAWLYKIATNACLDALAAKPERGRLSPGQEVLWLQPYPDPLLDAVAPADEQPDRVVVERETIELAFVIAVQLLPPRQRAVLLVRDVLGWSANETAALMDMSVPAANSALQRARETLKRNLPEQRAEWAAEPSVAEREVVQRYIDAHEQEDLPAVARQLAEDAKFFMPPDPQVVVGRQAIIDGLSTHGFEMGAWRLVPVRMNRMPALACYLKRAGDTAFRALAIDVLTLRGDEVAEITTFDERYFERLGLAAVLD